MAARLGTVLPCLIAIYFIPLIWAGDLGGGLPRDTFSYSRALLNPNPRCPEFLSARQLTPYAGLGHTFLAFNHLILIASAHNVTVKARFTSIGHGQNASLVDSFFFGDYFDAHVPDTAVIKLVECPTVEDFINTLAKHRAAGCVDGTAMMYEIISEITTREGTIDTRLYRAAFAHAEAFRMAYTARRGQDGMSASTRSDDGPASPAQTRFDGGDGGTQKCVRVAIHIRRGDLTYAKARKVFRNRWIPNRAYIQVVDAVYKALSTPLGKEPHSRVRHHVGTPSPVPADQAGASKTTNSSAPRLCVELFVQTGGLKSATKIPDLDSENTHGSTNFQERLARYGSVELDESDPLTSFARACSSDLFITSKSGYSHLISLMCGSPIILAFPSWLSYANIPNAMMVDEVGRGPKIAGQGPTYIDGAALNEETFLALAEKNGLVFGSG